MSKKHNSFAHHAVTGLALAGFFAVVAPYAHNSLANNSIPEPAPQNPLSASQVINNTKTSFATATQAAPVSSTAPVTDSDDDSDSMSLSEFLMTASKTDIDNFQSDNKFSLQESGFLNNGNEAVADEPEEDNFSSAKPTKKSHALAKPDKKSVHAKQQSSAHAVTYNAQDLKNGITLASDIVGISPDLLEKIMYLESTMNPMAYNKKSDTCGAGQFIVHMTWPEMVYKYSYLVESNLDESVDKYIVGKTRDHKTIYGYRAKKGHENELLQSCFNPHLSVPLYAMNIVEKMRAIDKKISANGPFHYVESDVYVAHFLGKSPGIILASRNNSQSLATSYASDAAISRNKTWFYDKKGHARTVGGFYTHIERDGHGPSQTTVVAPFWKQNETQFAAKAQLALNAG